MEYRPTINLHFFLRLNFKDFPKIKSINYFLLLEIRVDCFFLKKEFLIIRSHGLLNDYGGCYFIG